MYTWAYFMEFTLLGCAVQGLYRYGHSSNLMIAGFYATPPVCSDKPTINAG
jgi:hypothetical protein